MPAFSRFLRYFMAVGRHGSIRRAADELNVSASAIDRQILAAEAELELRLFERLPTGLRLTAAGELMMSAAIRWHKGLGDLRAQMDDLRGLRRGHVDIAMIDALDRGLIPRLVRRVQVDHPGISIGLKLFDNQKVHAAIVAGEVDFGMYLGPASSRDLLVRAHAEVVLGLVMQPDHPLGSKAERRFADTAGYPMVVPAEPLALCQQVAALQRATGVPMEIAATSDNIQMIKSLVLEGVGVGILTSLDVISEVSSGRLCFRRISDPVVRPLALALCTSPSRQLSSSALLVLGYLESAFNELSVVA